jgi:hypothetical protein
MRWVGPVLSAVILPLLLSEFGEWCPTFAKHLVRRAVRRLPEKSRARWEEEWLADLEAWDGRRLSVLVRGLWIYLRAPFWGRTLQGLPPLSERIMTLIKAIKRNVDDGLLEELESFESWLLRGSRLFRGSRRSKSFSPGKLRERDSERSSGQAPP